MEKVNDVIEATPLLTEKIDGTTLNQLICAAAITTIKTARVENECIIKKRNISRRKGDWTFNINWRINGPCADISKISQMNDPRPSPKMKKIANLVKTKYQMSTSKQDPPHSKHSNNVYMPLAIDSPDIKGDKNNTSKTTTL